MDGRPYMERVNHASTLPGGPPTHTPRCGTHLSLGSRPRNDGAPRPPCDLTTVYITSRVSTGERGYPTLCQQAC
jgi:hypothetical protein